MLHLWPESFCVKSVNLVMTICYDCGVVFCWHTLYLIANLAMFGAMHIA